MKNKKANNDDINKFGRQVYNYQSKDCNIKDFYFSRIENQLTGELISRNIEIQCISIKDMIKHQKLVDQSLMLYLEKMNKEAKNSECVYNASFSVSYKFPTFISNIESVVLNTSTSDKPYRISEVKTLGAYSNMEYSCWNVLNNKKIQTVFKGQYNKYSSYEENYAFSQVISLFACESSRNPTTYITAPMVLELAEHFYNNELREDKKTSFLKLSSKLNTSLLDEEEELKVKNELAKYEKEIEVLKTRSKTIKMCFEYYFPMAIDKAVSGARVTSDKLNKINNNKYFHQYDFGRPNINKEKELEEKNSVLKQLWEDTFPDREITELIKDWYDIELIGE